MFSEDNSFDFLEYSDKIDDVNEVYEDKEKYAVYKFYVSKLKHNYSRRYIKLPEVLAQIGGLLNVTLTIAEYLLYFYVDNEYMLYFFNSLFKLEMMYENEREEDVKKDEKQFKEIKSLPGE